MDNLKNLDLILDPVNREKMLPTHGYIWFRGFSFSFIKDRIHDRLPMCLN